MKKCEFRRREQNLYKYKASLLLAHPDYEKDIKELEDLKKEIPWEESTVNEFLKAFSPEYTAYKKKKAAFEKKYDISFPYDLKSLKKIAKGEKGWVSEMCRIVDLIETPLQEEEPGYIYLKIKVDESKDLVLYMVDSILTSTREARKEYKLINNRRFRPEKLRALEIYRLRCIGKTCEFSVLNRNGMATGERRTTVKKRTFREIGTELGIKADAVRKSYSIAHELIHGTPYKKGVKARVEKTLLKKECSTCKEKPSCKKPCPDILSFVNQDIVKGDVFHRNIRKLQQRK